MHLPWTWECWADAQIRENNWTQEQEHQRYALFVKAIAAQGKEQAGNTDLSAWWKVDQSFFPCIWAHGTTDVGREWSSESIRRTGEETKCLLSQTMDEVKCLLNKEFTRKRLPKQHTQAQNSTLSKSWQNQKQKEVFLLQFLCHSQDQALYIIQWWRIVHICFRIVSVDWSLQFIPLTK